MVKKSLILLIMILMTTVVFAETNYKYGEATIKIPCTQDGSNCDANTLCLIDVFNEKQSNIVESQVMDSQDGYFSYELPSNTTVGRYSMFVKCSNAQKSGSLETDFSITSKGTAGSNGLDFGVCASGESLTYFIIFGIVLLVLTILGMTMIRIPAFNYVMGLGWLGFSLFALPCSWFFAGIFIAFGVGVIALEMTGG